MRLMTYTHEGREQVGVRVGDRVVSVASIDPGLPTSLMGLLAGGYIDQIADQLGRVKSDGAALTDVQYSPLIPRPGKMLCIGRNYAAHAAEGGAQTPSFPEIFTRGATSLVGHGGDLVRPKCSDKFDFEGEFALVIGKTCRHATPDIALDFVAGYTLFHDATLRDYQRFATQWTIGKNFDGTGGFGPELVTADEVPPGLEGVTLTTHLNGEQMQIGNTADLVFPVRKLIVTLSEAMTLEPGDVIVTGTPSGVGAARKPPVFMQAGDVVEITIPELGTLRNTVRDEA